GIVETHIVVLFSNGTIGPVLGRRQHFARNVLGAAHLVAIIHPDNRASRGVAEKIGLEFEEDDRGGAIDVRSVYGLRL
ncbi:GNAT family N-acetyltransferase, partial [Cryobacterium sp. 10I1]